VVTRLARALALALALPVASGHVCSVGTEILLLLLRLVVVAASAGAMARWCGAVWCGVCPQVVIWVVCNAFIVVDQLAAPPPNIMCGAKN
jgi:hypothetical protein